MLSKGRKNAEENGEKGEAGMKRTTQAAGEGPRGDWDSPELRREFARDTAELFVGFILRCAPELLDLYVAQRWRAYERWEG